MVTIIGFILIISFGIVFLLYSSKNKGKSKSQKSGATKEEELSNEIKESHKVRGVSNKDIPQKDIADFMEFDKIADNMIVQNGGKRYTMVVQCKGINYDLMSEVEQMAVEEGFITFLNTLKYPIQLYVQARAVDLKENLNIYKKSVGEAEAKYNEIADKYRNLLNDIDADYNDINKLKVEVDKQAHILSYAQDITRYVERISLNKNILQRKFYIVLSYNREEIATTTDFSEQEIYNICYRELYTRAQSLISALMGCSVTGRVLTSNELAELLYISYNRDDEKLLDVQAALDSGFYRLYSTSKDVFEKKEEAMQREVEAEAKRRVQDAIDEIVQNKEQKTQDQLIEEYEERVDKEALNIIDRSDTPIEAKKLLKNNIVENHVFGVEARKAERKYKKSKMNQADANNDNEKNGEIIENKVQNAESNLNDEVKIVNENNKTEEIDNDLREKIDQLEKPTEEIIKDNSELKIDSKDTYENNEEKIDSKDVYENNDEKIDQSELIGSNTFDDRLGDTSPQDDDAGINI